MTMRALFGVVVTGNEDGAHAAAESIPAEGNTFEAETEHTRHIG